MIELQNLELPEGFKVSNKWIEVLKRIFIAVYGEKEEITIKRLLDLSEDTEVIEKLFTNKDPYYVEMKKQLEVSKRNMQIAKMRMELEPHE